MEILGKELAIFDKWNKELNDLVELNKKQVFDYRSKEGEKEARSYIFKLRKTKVALDKMRKDAKGDADTLIKKINAEAKRIRLVIESMIDVHERPIKEAEAAESVRIAIIKDKVYKLRCFASYTSLDNNLDEIKRTINKCEDFVIDDTFQEYKVEAENEKAIALRSLSALHDKCKIKEMSEQIKALEDEKIKDASEKCNATAGGEENCSCAGSVELTKKGEDFNNPQLVSYEIKRDHAIELLEKRKEEKENSELRAWIDNELMPKSIDHNLKIKKKVYDLFRKCGLNFDQSNNLFNAIDSNKFDFIKISY